MVTFAIFYQLLHKLLAPTLTEHQIHSQYHGTSLSMLQTLYHNTNWIPMSVLIIMITLFSTMTTYRVNITKQTQENPIAQSLNQLEYLEREKVVRKLGFP